MGSVSRSVSKARHHLRENGGTWWREDDQENSSATANTAALGFGRDRGRIAVGT